MDLHLSTVPNGEHWTGLLQTGTDPGGHHGLLLAHGQSVMLDWCLPMDSKIMLYNAKVRHEGNTAALTYDLCTQWIAIPADDTLTCGVVKEVCAGLGCMGMAAQH